MSALTHTHNKNNNLRTKIMSREESYEEKLSLANSVPKNFLCQYCHSTLKWEWKGSPQIRNPLTSSISTRVILKVLNSS